MAVFVLVHSMWHGAWSFERLKAELEAKGHTVIADDLAGCGSDSTPPQDVTLDGWVQDTVRNISSVADRVILVGHSRGGLVVSQTAEAVPDKIAASVYVTAMMMPSGKAGFAVPELLVEAGIETGFDSPVMPRFNETGTGMYAPEDAKTSIYGSVAESDRAWALPKMGIEPMGPISTPLNLTDERYGRVKRVYVETTLDKTMPLIAQRAMISRAQPVEVITLESDHMPNMTHVHELVDILDDVAHRYAEAVIAA